VSVVVDSSVLVAALLDSGPEGVWAEQIIDGGALYGPGLPLATLDQQLARADGPKCRLLTPASGIILAFSP
jgi:hypothetical protein